MCPAGFRHKDQSCSGKSFSVNVTDLIAAVALLVKLKDGGWPFPLS